MTKKKTEDMLKNHEELNPEHHCRLGYPLKWDILILSTRAETDLNTVIRRELSEAIKADKKANPGFWKAMYDRHGSFSAEGGFKKPKK